MFAGDKWSQCNTRSGKGIYIWTAGQWSNPNHKSRFVWKSADGSQEVMGYTNWDKSEDGYQQPNNAGGKENCVNLWPNFDVKWNDEQCDHEYCFVCEDPRVGCNN